MDGKNNQIWRMIFLITQIGFTMLTTIFLCIGLGFLIDRLFGTRLLVWFIVLGVMSGFRSVYILIRRYLDKDEKSDR